MTDDRSFELIGRFIYASVRLDAELAELARQGGTASGTIRQRAAVLAGRRDQLNRTADVVAVEADLAELAQLQQAVEALRSI